MIYDGEPWQHPPVALFLAQPDGTPQFSISLLFLSLSYKTDNDGLQVPYEPLEQPCPGANYSPLHLHAHSSLSQPSR